MCQYCQLPTFTFSTENDSGGSFLDPDDSRSLHPAPPLHHLHLLLLEEALQSAWWNGKTSSKCSVAYFDHNPSPQLFKNQAPEKQKKSDCDAEPGTPGVYSPARLF